MLRHGQARGVGTNAGPGEPASPRPTTVGGNRGGKDDIDDDFICHWTIRASGCWPASECLDRLAAARVGRVAFVSQGDPVILPVNHGMDGENIIFRTATGTKLLAADTEQVVAFEVDGYDADRRTGWSVLVRGVATTVEDQEEVKRLNLLGVWPWADLVERTHWVRINTLSHHRSAGRASLSRRHV